jgi:pyridoxal phosphate enzyme (YggS family)
MIHSVDSERLAEAIQVQAAKCNRTIDVLLEIHVAEEESKSGWAIEDLRAAVASGLFERLPNVRVRGVMGIATNTDDMERIVSDFVQLRIYKEELAAHFGEQFDTLSMGMSDDYPTAIAAGSTMVRIGSTIFGERDYSK